MEDFVLRCILEVTAGRFAHVQYVCDLVAGLSRYHPRLAVRLVDELLERVRAGLEAPEHRCA